MAVRTTTLGIAGFDHLVWSPWRECSRRDPPSHHYEMGLLLKLELAKLTKAGQITSCMIYVPRNLAALAKPFPLLMMMLPKCTSSYPNKLTTSHPGGMSRVATEIPIPRSGTARQTGETTPALLRGGSPSPFPEGLDATHVSGDQLP